MVGGLVQSRPLTYHLGDFMKRLMLDRKGAAAAEYAFILAVVSVALIAAVGTMGGGIVTAMTTQANVIKAAR